MIETQPQTTQPVPAFEPEVAPLVTLTDAAAAKLTELTRAEADPAVGLRVYVYSGGCSGYRYGMMLEDQPTAGGRPHPGQGINVYVDPQSTKLLHGLGDRLRGHAHGRRLHGEQPQRRLGMRLRQQLPHRGVRRLARRLPPLTADRDLLPAGGPRGPPSRLRRRG